MDNRLYNKTINCPVCSKDFEVTKVKSNAIKVLSRDTDFCVYYEGINPLLYDVWVCEHCGYAAQSEKFESIFNKEAKLVAENIKPRWTQRSFAGERTIDNAIDAFKLALYNLTVRKSKSSEFAKVCLRIAWLYRIKKDDKEKEYLQFALRNYNDAFEKERFPIDKLDEYTCMFIIAELHRRLSNLEEATKWFSKIISSPEARKNPRLLESARDQFMLIKEQNETSGQVASSAIE